LIEGAHKAFQDGTVAFEDVDLVLHRGEFVSIVGPSGCGKSTILKVAAGLLPLSEGSMTTTSDHLGFVFQDANLLPWRSVRRNVGLFLELQGVSADEMAPTVDAAIEMVGLTQFVDHLPRQLSGGMKMRVSLARALALNPQLFLFDEPFGALDEITRERLNEEVSSLFLRERFAGLFVTHSISEAVFMSTRVIVMSPRPGRIVASFDIPFSYPRDSELRFSPEFAACSAEISHALAH
jgi:NitT/TauT family transport system ATP-binding protein